MTEPPKKGIAESAAAHSTGGSAAGQAYREELARQGKPVDSALADLSAATAAKPPAPRPVGEARAAERKKVNGRARVVVAGAAAVVGKMVDISLTGACVMLDDMFPSKRACLLEFDIFHDGQRQVFSVSAQSVYGVLASGKGFKVGFQFGPITAAASKSIAALVA